MPVCSDCGAELLGGALFCPRCGSAVRRDGMQEGDAPVAPVTPDPAQPAVGPPAALTGRLSGEALPIPENVAAVIAYLTIVPALVMLFLEPFKRNWFVRFHAFQNILLSLAGLVSGIAAVILWAVLQLIPFMRVLVFPFAGLIGLAWFFLWLLLVVKAYRHEVFKLPIIGDLAEAWTIHGGPRWLGGA